MIGGRCRETGGGVQLRTYDVPALLISALLMLLSTFTTAGCDEGRLREHPFVGHEKRAVDGDLEAQEFVGLAYLNGDGASQSFTKAREWFKSCGEQGRARCQFELANLHEKGLGGPISSSKAGKYYRSSALGGEPRAMLRLGQFHRRGQGVPKDLVRACAWFHLAAETGYKPAKDILAAFNSSVADSVLNRGTVLAEKWRKGAPEF